MSHVAKTNLLRRVWSTHCTHVRQERQVYGKLVIEFIKVVLIFIQLAFWESIVVNILILIMNTISGLSPTKIAKSVAKLLTNASTVG